MTRASGFDWRSSSLWGNVLTLALLAIVAGALSTLQSNDWWLATPRANRWIEASVVLLAYFGFCGLVFWRTQTRTPVDDAVKDNQPPAVLVAYASQTGFAQQLAERTADNLRNAGLPVKLRAIGDVDAALLATSKRALFVASTTGEGDPPDPALGFVRGVMSTAPLLAHLHYAVLALGDREYEDYCGFGHAVDNWLRQHGARPLFDVVEVDNADQSALRHWQHHLGRLAGVTDLPDWSPPRYEQWKLIERREINPHSVGGGVFHVAIAPPTGAAPQWVAGDIAEVGPRQSPASVAKLLSDAALSADAQVMVAQESRSLSDLLAASHLPTLVEIQGRDAQAIADSLRPLPHREYSIASLPDDGSVHLLLRRMRRPDGTPGLGSGWLCDYANMEGPVALRLRSNPNFHGPRPGTPMILIGNGTGIAGLRAHLKQRIAEGSHRNWLIFGERNADRDYFHGDEIRQWQAQGGIERVDLAFSRDQAERVYVQHKVLENAELVREWLAEGTCVYVCGSLDGMAPSVDSALRQIVGDDAVENLLVTGRYRRDVY